MQPSEFSRMQLSFLSVIPKITRRKVNIFPSPVHLEISLSEEEKKVRIGQIPDKNYPQESSFFFVVVVGFLIFY